MTENSLKSLFLIISGPSGSGKSTLSKMLLSSENLDFHLSVSTTTRAPREKEQEGKDYFFVPKQVFQNMLHNDEFVEHAEIYDHLYGTHTHALNSAISKKQNLIFDIDYRGNRDIIKRYSTNKMVKILSIYVVPPSIQELELRLKNRGDSPGSIQRRISMASEEMEFSREYSHIITNQNIIDSYAELENIVINFMNDDSR